MKNLTFKKVAATTISLIAASQLLVVGLAVNPVYAATTNPTTTTNSNITTRIADLQNRAYAEIDKRVTALTGLCTKIQDNKRLTSTQKSGFCNQIQTEVTNLNTLRAKITTDGSLPVTGNTIPAQLKTDVQSVIISFRVYALVVPQIHILIGADLELQASEKFTTVIDPKLNTVIQKDAAKGEDVTAMQTAYNDLTQKIADAQTQANAAINLVTGLAPSQYPGFVTTLKTAIQDLKQGHQDLMTARTDAQTIIRLNKSMNPRPASAPVAQ